MYLHEGFKELKVPTVNQLINIKLCKFFYKLINNMLPNNLTECELSNGKGTGLVKSHKYGTCKKHLPNLPFVHDLQYKNSFLSCSNILYNELPDSVKEAVNLSNFVKNVKEFLMLKS